MPPFQESIREMRIKCNRRDDLITKEYLMAEALSSYNTLVLENKWITQDPKSVAFTQLLSKAETIFKNYSPTDGKGGKKGGRIKKVKKPKGDKKYAWKLGGPKKGESKTKKVDNKTYHWCHKESGLEKKPMWSLHTPEDHKGHTPRLLPRLMMT